MVRNIIWDVDGTLFDTYPAIAKAFKAALNDRGQDADLAWIEDLAKKSLGHCASTLAETYQLNEEEVGERFGEHYDRVKPEAQPPFPGVIAICRYICSIGGKNLIITHRGQEGTTALLAAHKMTPYFAGYLTRDDGYPKKPNPAAFEAILSLHNLERAETITVGDRDIDILAGQAAGLLTCLFGSRAEGVSAALTITNFDELYAYLLSASDRV